MKRQAQPAFHAHVGSGTLRGVRKSRKGEETGIGGHQGENVPMGRAYNGPPSNSRLMSDTPLVSSLFPAATEGSLEARFAQGISFEEFLPTAQKNVALWQSVWDRARLPDDLVARAAALPGAWHLLVLSEDWCGDAVNIVPVLARLAGAVPTLDLRLLSRDAHLDLMDAHLTNGKSRSIPVVILLDEDFVERGWWGPRPTDLQAWVLEEGLKMDAEERYKIVRRFYARDKGRTTLEEIVSGIESVAGRR